MCSFVWSAREFNLASNSSIYDSCNFCNRRFLLQLSFLKNIGNMAAYTRLVNAKELRHSLLCGPNGLVSNDHLHLAFLVRQLV